METYTYSNQNWKIKFKNWFCGFFDNQKENQSQNPGELLEKSRHLATLLFNYPVLHSLGGKFAENVIYGKSNVQALKFSLRLAEKYGLENLTEQQKILYNYGKEALDKVNIFSNYSWGNITETDYIRLLDAIEMNMGINLSTKEQMDLVFPGQKEEIQEYARRTLNGANAKKIAYLLYNFPQARNYHSEISGSQWNRHALEGIINQINTAVIHWNLSLTKEEKILFRYVQDAERKAQDCENQNINFNTQGEEENYRFAVSNMERGYLVGDKKISWETWFDQNYLKR
ncbi:MAG: hypothetical protein ACOYT4_05030 [Nanoarchaeota archaeon]